MKVFFNKACLVAFGLALGGFPSPSGVRAQGNDSVEESGASDAPTTSDVANSDAANSDTPAGVPSEDGAPGEDVAAGTNPADAGDSSAGVEPDVPGDGGREGPTDAAAADEDVGEGEPSEEDDSYWDDGAMYGAAPGDGDDGDNEEGEGDEGVNPDEPFEEPTHAGASAFVVDPLRMGGSVQQLGQDQLDALEYDDPHATLLQVPGVYVRTEDGFGLRPNIGLRGGNPERSRRVTLMEDGVLFGPAPYAAPAAYYFPLMTRMTGVDVYKGPAALLYGPQTIGGAIDLTTRPVPFGSAGELDVSYGRFNARKLHLHWGTSNRWGGFLFEALDVASEGFKEIDGDEDADTGFWRTDFMARGFLQTNPSRRVFNRLELKLGFQREVSNETYLGLSDADFADDPTRRYAASGDDQMRWWRTQGQLTWTLSVGDTFDMVTDVYRHDFDRNWDRLAGFEGNGDLRSILLAPTGSRAVYYEVLRGEQDSNIDEGTRLLRAGNQRRFVSQGVQSRARIRAQTGPARHVVELGLRFHHDRVHRQHTQTIQRMVNGDLVRETEPVLSTENRGNAYATSAHLVYGLEIAGLTLRPGVRTEVVHTRMAREVLETSLQTELRAILLPGIGVTYAITPEVSMVAGVHRGYSPVAPGQPEEIKPETSISYEFGARYLSEEGGRLLELVGFLNDYDNLQGQCAFSTGCSEDMLDRQFNGGAVWVWGAEAAAAWTFDLGEGFSIPARASYTYTGSHFRAAFESQDPTLGRVEEGDELPYVPEHQGQVQAGLDHPRGGMRVVANFIGEMREEAGQGEPADNLRTDMQAMVDVVGYYQPMERLRFYLRLENVTNTQPLVSRRP